MSGITADRSRGTARSASNVLAAETIDELVSGLVPASGGRVEILAPFTGETLHLLPHNTAAEVERADALPLAPWIPTLKYDYVRIAPASLSGRAFRRGPEPDRYGIQDY